MIFCFWVLGLNPSLQRWFGYCSSAKKKRSCPVCKQTCSAKNVNRLYFQSVGDSNDQNLTQPKNESQGKDIQDAKKEVNSIAFGDLIFFLFVYNLLNFLFMSKK